jgi:CRP/FNR family transcriptional regulator, anaerobic regulatory protein
MVSLLLQDRAPGDSTASCDVVGAPEVPTATTSRTPATALGSRCADCRFHAACIGCAFRTALGFGGEPLVGYRRHLAANEVLFHAGARCTLIHVVQAGFFKTVVLSDDGAEQITGFQMPGDLLGLDGLGTGVHAVDAIAITEASVCVVSRARLLQANGESEELRQRLLAALCDEIRSDHGTMLLLGCRSAEERVAGFLIDLSERLAGRGYSACDLGLWMTREEIGAFLGLELETVSRALSSLIRHGLIEVHRRAIRITDMRGLREAVAGHAAHARHQRDA